MCLTLLSFKLTEHVSLSHMKEWIYDTYSTKWCRKRWRHGQKMRKLFWREKEFCLQLCWIWKQVSLSGDTLKLGEEIGAKDVDCRVISIKEIVEAELCLVSHVWLFATPWSVAHQAPLSIEFSRQEYWSGLPYPSQKDLPNLGVEPRSPSLQVDSLPSKPLGKPKNIPYSRGSSWPRNWTRVFCIAGGFFTSWATREVHRSWECLTKAVSWAEG